MLRINKSGLTRKNAGFTLLETTVVVVVLAILAAVGIPTYAAVITKANDKAHLASLQAIAEATQVSYANGADGMTWSTALAEVLSSSTTAAGSLTTLAAAPTADPTSGPSLQTTQVSYAQTVHGGGTLAYSTDELGLAAQNPSGNCAMVITSPSGLVDSWVAGKLGANCTGAEALAGRATVAGLHYLSPSDYGAPHPITNLSIATQSYDPVSKTISGPSFTFTPSTSGDVASVEVKRNGIVIDSLSKSANSYTDTSSTPATSYNYTFTVIDNSELTSTPVTQSVDTKPGALLGGALTYLINSGAADATLSWDAPDPTAKITGYHIYRNGTLTDALIGSSTTSATLLAQPLGTSYSYDVLPYNSAGDGLGFQVSQTFISTPLAPSTITATTSDSQVTLTWSAVTATTAAPVSGYYLYRSIAGGPYLFLSIAIGQPTTTYLDATAVNGTAYSYKVASYGVAGTGAQSSPSSAVTPIGAPLAGTVGTPSLALGSVSFALSFPTSAANPIDHFLISRSGTTLNSNYPAASTSYTDTTITPGATYTYSVTAVNSSGSSPTATTASVTTIMAPAAPTMATPIPADGQVALSWSIPTPTAQAPVSGYRIYSSSGGPYTLLTQVAPSTTLNYTDTSPTNGVAYSYEIESYGAGGTSSRSPATTPVTPLGAPAPVSITSALAPLGGGSVTVGFSSVSTPTNPVTTITVTRNGSAYTTLPPSATTFTDTTTTNGVGYIYAITTHNALFASSPVSTSTLTPFGTAPAPSIATAVASDAKTTLTWAKITSTPDTPVDGYRLYRSVNSSPFTLLTQITPASQTSYNDTGLINGSSYTYELSAYGDGGESSRSAPSTTLTPLGSPAAVTITSATPASGGGSIIVNFTSTSSTANPVSSITVTRNSLAWRTLASSANTFTDNTITNGTSYTYAITTHNSLSASAPVSTPSLTAYAVSAAPNITSATPANAQVALVWTQVTSTTDTPVDGYRIYRSTSGGAYTLLTQVLGSTTTTYTDTSPTNGVSYSYELTSYGSGGQSPNSAASSTVTPLATPATPSISSATVAAGGASITINFTTSPTLPAPITSLHLTRNGSALATLASNATSYTDSAITTGTPYTYAITASNALYTSSAAATSALTAYAVPAAPTFSAATAANAQVSLTWSQATSTTATPVTGYRLYRSTSYGAYTLLTQLTPLSANSYTDNSVTNGVSYSYKVTSYGSGGESAASTPTATLTPLGVPASPVISSATAASGGGSITVNFTEASTSANPVTTIVVTRNGSAYTTLTPAATSFTDATVTNGSSYIYTLTASNALYSSAAVSTASLTPTAAPSAPSFTATTPASNQVSLTWSAVTSTTAAPVTGYRLYVSLNSGAYTLLTTQPSTTYTDSSALNGNNYSYRVEAYGTGGTSAQGTSPTVTPSGLPAAAPVITSTPTSTSTTTLNWSAVTSTTASPVTGYALQRSTTSSSGPWTTIYTGAALTYSATGLSTGNSYYYRVAATNATGSGNYSSSAFYTPGATPVIYSVTPANASATLTFSGMTINQGEYLQSVALLACSDAAMSANCVNTYIDIQPMVSYTVYYLNNGTPYYFKSIYTTTLRAVSSAVVGSFTPNAPPAYPPAFTYTNPTNSSNQTLFNFPAAITSVAAPVTTTGIQFCQDQAMTSGCVSYNFSNSTTSLLVNLSTNFPTGSMLQGRLYATNWMGTTYGYPENITAYNPAPTALAPTVTSATSYYINLSWPQVPSTQAAPVTNLYIQYCADAAMTTSCNTTSWINPPVTSTTIWYLSANTTYYFRIEVVGASTTYGPVTRGSTTP